MNYKKVYDQIIERGQKENRSKGKGVYYEKHHIVPKCMGGCNTSKNLVLLTAREHYICHLLLLEVYPYEDGLHHAVWVLACTKEGLNISSRTYARLKVIASRAISKANKGRKKPPLTEQHKKKISETLKNRKVTWGHKISEGKKGRKLTEEQKQKVSTFHKGRKRSAETREKISEARKNSSHPAPDTSIPVTYQNITYPSIRSAVKATGIYYTKLKKLLQVEP